MSNLRQASALLEGLVFDDSALKYKLCQMLRAQESSSERFISEDRYKLIPDVTKKGIGT